MYNGREAILVKEAAWGPRDQCRQHLVSL